VHVTRPAVLAALAVLACRSDLSRETASPGPTPGATTPSADAPPRASAPPRAAPADPEPGRLAGITAAHNRVRAALDLPPLEWSPELARFAQTWADKLRRGGCDLRHRPRAGADAQRYGENIYSATGQTPDSAAVVDAWAAEARGYDARTNRCRGVCGHYTQVVWRSSRRLGCGTASCGDTEVWVCNYDPPGNFLGERPY
jgi:uncharacterized protein YkwD